MDGTRGTGLLLIVIMDHSRKFPTFRTSKWKGAWTYWSKLNWWNLALMIKQSCEHIRIIGHLHSKAADLMSFSQCSVNVHYLRYNNGHLKGMLIDPCISLHIIKLVILQFCFSTHRSYGWRCSVHPTCWAAKNGLFCSMLMPHFHVSLMASPTLHFWRSCW